MQFDISPLDTDLKADLQTVIDGKTKPLGALGRLEELALQIGLIQNTTTPSLERPTIVVCAGDHGATAERVSAYPSAVTAQMVLNFLSGGAAINVFAQQNGLALNIVDSGVNYDFDDDQRLVNAKIALGTQNYVHQPAMSTAQCAQALANGAAIVSDLQAAGCNTIGFGEMGIGNSASAALIMALLCELPIARCAGAGSGLDELGVQHKIKVLEQARQRIIERHGPKLEPLTALAEAGGFEIATICGSLLRAAELRMVILIDGFIVTAALMVAHALDRNLLDYCIFSHRSDEVGHALMLDRLRARPLLHLKLRLGEGTGAALAYPLVAAAVHFLNEMASFESAGVSAKQDA